VPAPRRGGAGTCLYCGAPLPPEDLAAALSAAAQANRPGWPGAGERRSAGRCPPRFERGLLVARPRPTRTRTRFALGALLAALTRRELLARRGGLHLPPGPRSAPPRRTRPRLGARGWSPSWCRRRRPASDRGAAWAASGRGRPLPADRGWDLRTSAAGTCSWWCGPHRAGVPADPEATSHRHGPARGRAIACTCTCAPSAGACRGPRGRGAGDPWRSTPANFETGFRRSPAPARSRSTPWVEEVAGGARATTAFGGLPPRPHPRSRRRGVPLRGLVPRLATRGREGGRDEGPVVLDTVEQFRVLLRLARRSGAPALASPARAGPRARAAMREAASPSPSRTLAPLLATSPRLARAGSSPRERVRPCTCPCASRCGGPGNAESCPPGTLDVLGHAAPGLVPRGALHPLRSPSPRCRRSRRSRRSPAVARSHTGPLVLPYARGSGRCPVGASWPGSVLPSALTGDAPRRHRDDRRRTVLPLALLALEAHLASAPCGVPRRARHRRGAPDLLAGSWDATGAASLLLGARLLVRLSCPRRRSPSPAGRRSRGGGDPRRRCCCGAELVPTLVRSARPGPGARGWRGPCPPWPGRPAMVCAYAVPRAGRGLTPWPRSLSWDAIRAIRGAAAVVALALLLLLLRGGGQGGALPLAFDLALGLLGGPLALRPVGRPSRAGGDGACGLLATVASPLSPRPPSRPRPP